MKLLDTPMLLSEEFDYLVHGIVRETLIRPPATPTHEAAWRKLIDELASWGERGADMLEDEGVEPPQPSIVHAATELASIMRDRDMEPPGRLMPNGDGGIVFRWRVGECAWTVEFESDGSIESCLVRRGKLIRRHSLHEGGDVQ